MDRPTPIQKFFDFEAWAAGQATLPMPWQSQHRVRGSAAGMEALTHYVCDFIAILGPDRGQRDRLWPEGVGHGRQDADPDPGSAPAAGRPRAEQKKSAGWNTVSAPGVSRGANSLDQIGGVIVARN